MLSRVSLVAFRAAALRPSSTKFAPLLRNATFAQPQLNGVRGFASAREDLLKRLKEEIRQESEDFEIQSKQSREHSSSFKVISDNKSGEIVLGHETDGYKISVKFNAKDLAFTYHEDEDPVSTLPIEIEIAPNGADLAILVTGEIEERAPADGDSADVEVEQAPYFTPATVQIGKPGAISEDAFSPNVDELDEELQDCFSEWLSDFEIDHDLFQMVMDQAEKRENAIYLDWLKDLKKVVEKKN